MKEKIELNVYYIPLVQNKKNHKLTNKQSHYYYQKATICKIVKKINVNSHNLSNYAKTVTAQKPLSTRILAQQGNCPTYVKGSYCAIAKKTRSARISPQRRNCATNVKGRYIAQLRRNRAVQEFRRSAANAQQMSKVDIAQLRRNRAAQEFHRSAANVQLI